MNIFYEEGGQFKVAAVVQKNDNSYQADTQSGKRAKIKAGNVFLEFDGDMDAFLSDAQREAAEIDTELLWECCGTEEFTAEHAAAEYFGGRPSAPHIAAVLVALYAAPMYFHKKNKGVFKAAPEDILKQALAAIERKKQQEAQIQAWADELVSGRLPESMAGELATVLHAPDKQSLAYKAFHKAADNLKMSAYELAKHCGGIHSLEQYLLQGFAVKHFPQGTGFADISLPCLPELPVAASVRAFSIDDASTTEIDDALSVQDLGGGAKRIGIHIAAPALGVQAGSEIENVVQDRQSTVYFPGGKITMLPENWIAAFSLDEGALRPAFSIYFDADADGGLSEPVSRIERVEIVRNLRIEEIEPYFNSESGIGAADNPQFPFHAEMIYLHGLAVAQQKKRERYEENVPKKYDYSIELAADRTVRIGKRERGSPIDTVVSEMMILANSAWAELLDENGTGGLFRVQPPLGRVRMSTKAEAHSGMNLSHYGWFTSPLRRAADCINQRQLYSLLDNTVAPRYAADDNMLFAALSRFETAHAAYGDFQAAMEAYWSLVWLEQEQVRELHAVILKDDLVRIDGLPLVARVSGIPAGTLPRTMIKVAVGEVDSEKQWLALRYVNVVPQAA